MQKIDTKELLAQSNILDIIGRHVPLQKKGSEYYGVCPFHDDQKESLQVNERKQIFSCFACGRDDVAGDSIHFLQLLGRTFYEACEEINGGEIQGEISIKKNEGKKRDTAPVWSPVPGKWPKYPKGFKHFKMGVPSKVWAYKNAKGTVIGYVCRFDLADGEKQVIPLMYGTDGQKTQWRWQGLPVPRPLYNLNLITKNPDAQILVVEGEKTADAAQVHLDPKKWVVTTWIGGANGIKNANWEPLKGRKVTFWPDHDTTQKYGKTHPKAGQIKPWFEQPGNHAMLEIDKLIKLESKSIDWVDVPDELPHKWDAADRDDWTGETMLAFIADNVGEIPVISDVREVDGLPQVYMKELEDETDSKIDKSAVLVPSVLDSGTVNVSKKNPELPPIIASEYQSGNINLEDYFRFLGYDTDENTRLVYYFFSFDAKSVVKLSPSSMSKSNLMMLAPINVWEDRFGGSGRQKLNLDSAQQFLVMKSHRVGVFREKCIRGRGAWMDEDRLVIHVGEHLLVDNEIVSLKGFKSRFVYQVGEDLGIGTESPLEAVDSSKLIGLLEWLEWERGVNSFLLAGWCVIAPFCGVLDWRPHIWITGPMGSGKSWTMDNIVKKLMGRVAVVVQGKTTEAGVRGTLQSDARPVLYDESDVDGFDDRSRVQSILALARSASYRDGGVISKGTQNGNSRSYVIRSCFAFSSIGIQLNQQSDRSRFTTLGLRSFEKTKTKEDFAKFELGFNALVTDDYVRRLQARTMRLIPVIMANSKTFADAASHLIGSRRVGDQIGGMLAGAYSLKRSDIVTYEFAVEWVNGRDWDDEKGLEQTTDEYQLFSIIISETVKMESQNGFLERTIGELALYAKGSKNDSFIASTHANDRLRRLGVMIRGDQILIANNSPAIKEMIRNTPWARGHNKVLERLPGAEKISSLQFVPGLKSRSIALPFSMLLEDPKDIETSK